MKPSYSKWAAYLAVGAALIFWQNAAVAGGRTSVPAGLLAAVMSPLERGMTGVAGWCGDVIKVVLHRGGILEENAALQGRLADVEGQNQRLLRYQAENQELRGLLHLAAPPGGYPLAAQIVSFDATDFARRVTLDVGARQGVRVKDVVYCAYGLVGKVEAVGPLTCVVYLLTDREAGTDAMTTRTAAKGVVLGTGERLCKFSFLDFDCDVREGDLVMTSGLITGRGAIFPRGMIIGTVVRVERDKTYSRLDAYVEPAVPFDRISTVYVRVGAG